MDKAELRKEFLEKRKNLTNEQLAAANRLIWERLKEFLEWEHIKGLHLYLSIPGQHEVDTQPIVDYVREFHPLVDIVVPRITNEEKMEHVLWKPHIALQPNQWGIPEPVEGTLYDINDLQVVIVPLIIFDLNGHRIGYGKGYYDRFLGSCLPVVEKVGLSIFSPAERIRTEATDVPLDAVITPEKIYQFQKP